MSPSLAYSPIVHPERTDSISNHPLLPLAMIPWAAAVFLTPLWYGGVSEGAQAAVGLLLAFSLLLCAGEIRILPLTRRGRMAMFCLVGLLFLAIIPLPLKFLGTVDPAAAGLWRSFPVTAHPALFGTISLSPGDTIQRLGQLGMLFGCFLLARTFVRGHRFAPWFARGLAWTVILLGSTQIWLILDGKGVWPEVRHHPAGTFANRNHFADWMAVASIFLMGPLIRQVRSLKADANQREIATLILFATAILTGMALTISCGSRGGILALGSGLVCWALILFRRSERGIAVGIFAAAFLLCVIVFAISGERTMARLNDAGLGLKFSIWRDSVRIFEAFPLFGVGLGGFQTAFTMHKTFGAQSSFLFAENDYLQWALETGVAGTAAAAAIFIPAGWRLWGAIRSHRSGAEYFDAALAGLGAFAVHAAFEFVTHVMALALLAAALAGIACGFYERWTGPRVPLLPSRAQIISVFALGLLMAFAGTVRAAGIYRPTKLSETAAAEQLRMSPNFASSLEKRSSLAWSRMLMTAAEENRISPELARLRAQAELTAALKWWPLDWELRLERAWLDLASTSERFHGVTEARMAMRLNPLQAKIPVRLAAAIGQWNAQLALEILREAPLAQGEDILAAFQTVWRINQDPAELWQFTPATDVGFAALEHFARDHDLVELAEEARRRRNGNR